MTYGCPHITPLWRRGLGGELGSEIMTDVLERCGVRLLCCWCHAGSVRRRPNDQERCVVGSRLLAFGCLGSRSSKMRRLIR